MCRIAHNRRSLMEEEEDFESLEKYRMYQKTIQKFQDHFSIFLLFFYLFLLSNFSSPKNQTAVPLLIFFWYQFLLQSCNESIQKGNSCNPPFISGGKRGVFTDPHPNLFLKREKMEEECDFRRWDELIPDTLGLIFRNLSLLEILTVVPRVCKSWGRAVTGPYCWQEIDIEEWSRQCQPEDIDRMLQLLITRSCGSFQKLCVSGISDDLSFVFVANHAKSLQTLRLPRSEISNSVVEQVAAMLSSLTFLDLSYCKNIGAQALEAIGKNCKSLSGLRRIMHPLEVIDKLSQDDEAMAITSTMPKLHHLEIAYLLVDTSSVIEIIRNCRELELLDIRGCWNVSLDENFVKKFSKLKIIGPHVMDYYDIDNWDSCSDYSSSSDFLEWDLFADDMDDNDDDEDYEDVSDGFWEDDERIEDIEMWFYNDIEAIDAGYDWPQSP